MCRTRLVFLWLVLCGSIVGSWAQGPELEEPRIPAVTESETVPTIDPHLASDPQELFARGVQLATDGRVREALTVFKALTIAHPELAEPHANLASLLASTDPAAAADAAENALRTHPVCRAAFELRLLEDLGDHSLALLNGDKSAEGRATSPPLTVAEPLAKVVPGSTSATQLASATTSSPTEATTVASATAGSSDSAALQVVGSLVSEWAAAWAARDPASYLDFYGKQFEPGRPRQEWLQEREQRLVRPSFIEIGIEDLQLEEQADGRVVADFIQLYRSDRHRDQVRKRLIFAWESGSWKIVAEHSMGS